MPLCPHRQQLILEWRGSILKFADEVKRLAEYTKSVNSFVDQFQATDLARQNVENARAILQTHRAEHDC
jgi:hypothetical protein